MNYLRLIETDFDVLKKIEEAEKNGDFSAHLDPIDYSLAEPVTADFPYIPGKWLRILYWWRNVYLLNGFTWVIAKGCFKTQIMGKENLKKVKNAVVTCNHINKYDGLVIRYALGKKKLKIMTADFNNQKGFLGKMMRAAGILPFSMKRECIKKFNESVAYYLSHNTSLLIFPEGSEWWCYEKPRPLMDGAFHYAVTNNKPVLPCFITFRKNGKFFDSGIEKRDFIVHILEPIFPDENLSKKENIKIMKEKNFVAWCECYKKWYGEEPFSKNPESEDNFLLNLNMKFPLKEPAKIDKLKV